MIYTRIYDAFWKDEDIRVLDDASKLLYLYLLTCRHRTMIGLYEMPKGYIADDLRWGIDRVSKGLRCLIDKGFILYDEPSRFVLIPMFLKHNPLDGPKQEAGAVNVFKKLPNTALFLDFLNCLETLPIPYRSLIDTVSHTLSNEVNRNTVNRNTVNSEEGNGGGTGEPAAKPPAPPAKKPNAETEPERFTTFWNCYPNKKAKPVALKAWLKLNPDEKLYGEIIHGLSRAKLSEQWQKDGGAFIPHPATFLNQRRWEDDYKAGGGGRPEPARETDPDQDF
jgi:hypothetical protein